MPLPPSPVRSLPLIDLNACVDTQHVSAQQAMASGIAHELCNILTAVIGNTAGLIEKLPDNGELNNQAQRVQQAAERGMVLTEELEGSAGHQPVRRAPCCIRRLLENFTSEQLERLPSHVTLASHCSELPSDMAIDAVNLKKSLGEIIDNATRAAGRTPLALTLTASTAQITPQERSMRGVHRFSRQLDREASLADPGGTGDRHESRSIEIRLHRSEIDLPTDEGSGPDRNPRRCGGLGPKRESRRRQIGHRQGEQ